MSAKSTASARVRATELWHAAPFPQSGPSTRSHLFHESHLQVAPTVARHALTGNTSRAHPRTACDHSHVPVSRLRCESCGRNDTATHSGFCGSPRTSKSGGAERGKVSVLDDYFVSAPPATGPGRSLTDPSGSRFRGTTVLRAGPGRTGAALEAPAKFMGTIP